MCGVVAAVADRDVGPPLREGLPRLEYRGHDSAGLAVIREQRGLHPELADRLVQRAHALFLARGMQYPVALADKNMPVIALVANEHLAEKVKSSVEEGRAGGGELVPFAAPDTGGARHDRAEAPPAGGGACRADSVYPPPAATRISRGREERHGHGRAPQSRKNGHGRIKAWITWMASSRY